MVPVHVPPLRERRGDVALLAEHFLANYLDENGLPPREFTPEALQLLGSLPWPGNIRELGNAVERLAILSLGPVIGPGGPDAVRHRRATPRPAAPGFRADGVGLPAFSTRQRSWPRGAWWRPARNSKKRCITAALAGVRGNVSQAARLLGIDRTNLHKKIQAYGLGPGKDGDRELAIRSFSAGLSVIVRLARGPPADGRTRGSPSAPVVPGRPGRNSGDSDQWDVFGPATTCRPRGVEPGAGVGPSCSAIASGTGSCSGFSWAAINYDLDGPPDRLQDIEYPAHRNGPVPGTRHLPALPARGLRRRGCRSG